MSLVGNLEDLSLGDILQIVSLSRKSGVLSLESRQRQGRIVFHDGQVVRATSSAFQENLGDLLLRRGLVDLDTLRSALKVQRQTATSHRLGEILASRFQVPGDAIEEAVKEQVETIVYSFFGWNEGTFSFELGEAQEAVSASVDPLQFILEQGLNPQWLAMEGSRILDEKRHRGESLEEEAFASRVSVESLLGDSDSDRSGVEEKGSRDRPEQDGATVLLVDDDLLVRERLSRILRRSGVSTRLFDSAAPALEAVRSEAGEERAPVLVVDLEMPAGDSSSMQGGLDLLRRVRKELPQVRILPMADQVTPRMEAEVRSLGLRGVLAKPSSGELRREGRSTTLEAFGDQLALWLRETEVASGHGQPLYNFGAELLRELGEPEVDGSAAKGPESPGLHLLKGMLLELNNPSLGGGIILLVLRFASELMNRAVIFLVKEREVVGLGQFGIELDQENADARVRKMKIPTDEDSVLTQVLEGMVPLHATPGRSRWDRYLQKQLGGGEPAEVFLGPILSEGKVVALLYGDNLPEQSPIGDTEALEIFLSQAGLAMEKALLERRLRSRGTA